MIAALLRCQHEHAMPAALEFEPGEIHFRVQRVNVNLTVAHFNDQQALLGQVIRRFSEHASNQIQPIITASQTQLGLMLIFIRHISEIFRIHVRRVRHDQVETLTGKPSKPSPCTV